MGYACFDPDYGPYLGACGDPRNEDDGCSACDTCGGDGTVKETVEYHGGPAEVKVDCAECKGLGHFDKDGVPFRLLRSGEREYAREITP